MTTPPNNETMVDIDRLRERDALAWALVEEKVIPAILARLKNALGPSRGVLDVEGLVRSMQRSFLRRLDVPTESNLANLRSLDDLRAYCFVMARNKGYEVLRHTAVENKLAPIVVNKREQLSRSQERGRACAQELVDLVVGQLRDDDERLLFALKLQGYNEVEIAQAMNLSQRTIRRRWERICSEARKWERGE